MFLFGLAPGISGFVLQAGLEQSRSRVSLFACVAIALTERTRNNRETLVQFYLKQNYVVNNNLGIKMV